MKIIRTPTEAKGGITDKERAELAKVAEKWTKNALRTDTVDPAKTRDAIDRLYAAAGLDRPRVVIVPSPLVMAFSYGAAAAIWHSTATRAATLAATVDATRDATWDATDEATWAATWNATRAATDEATRAATRDATLAATRDATAATWAATDQATREATLAATRAATRAATEAATLDATDEATRVATRAASQDATLDATWAATWNATRAATDEATDQATRAATWGATRAATEAATWDATWDATDEATWDATRAATRAATEAATLDATWAATWNATRAATRDATLTCEKLAGRFGLECAKRWHAAYQGGNMWSHISSMYDGFRDVLGLQLPEFEKYQAWEDASINGGFRVMHEKFCIVSDFPEVLEIDGEDQPHCSDGPSHRWRDGWELFHWHGQKVPREWIMEPESVNMADVIQTENVDKRAAGVDIFGWGRILEALDATVIDDSGDPYTGRLIEVSLPDHGRQKFISGLCGTGRQIAVMASNDAETIIEAQAFAVGMTAEEFQIPEIRT